MSRLWPALTCLRTTRSWWACAHLHAHLHAAQCELAQEPSSSLAGVLDSGGSSIPSQPGSLLITVHSLPTQRCAEGNIILTKANAAQLRPGHGASSSYPYPTGEVRPTRRNGRRDDAAASSTDATTVRSLLAALAPPPSSRQGRHVEPPVALPRVPDSWRVNPEAVPTEPQRRWRASRLTGDATCMAHGTLPANCCLLPPTPTPLTATDGPQLGTAAGRIRALVDRGRGVGVYGPGADVHAAATTACRPAASRCGPRRSALRRRRRSGAQGTVDCQGTDAP